MRPALMRGPSTASRPGRAPQAMTTLIAVTTTRAVASETSSVPGWRKAEAKSETKRVDPAKTTVRPAVRRLRSAAADGDRPGGELLAEAGHDQEGVVDAERQAHHRADDEGERVDPHERAEQDEDAAAGENGHRAEEKRNRRRDQGAKDQEQDDDQQRGGEQLGPLGGAQRFLLQGPGDRRESGLRRRHGTVDAGGEGAFERRYGVADRRRERQVVVDQDEGAIRTRAKGGGRAVFPGGDRRRGAVAAQRRDQARALAVDGRRRAAQHDGEWHRFAEILAGERFAAR